MCNVNKPAFFTETCMCRVVEQRLKEKGFNGTLPKVNGHIFLIGREYNGPCKEVLCSHACDIPKPTGWDVKRVWNQVREHLPDVFKANVNPKQWENVLTECRVEGEKPMYSRVNTAAVFTLRKLMKGLVCGPMDKNNGELWMVCPTLYTETVDKLFATTAVAESEEQVSQPSSNTKEIPLDCWDKVRKEGEKGALPQRTPKKGCRWADVIKDGAEKALPQRVKKAVTQNPNTMEEPSAEKSKDTDYKKVYPKKLTAYKKHRYSGDELTKHIIGTDIPKKRSRGTVKDIINVWRQFYKKQKWDKLARFNTKGKLGVPYALFKAKNIIDPEVRKHKWNKARPITPTFDHPMKKLLHMMGKAWYFVAKKMKGEHFIIDNTWEVPNFLDEVMATFGEEEYEAHVLDIEGCFPSMPKEKIRFAMMQLVQEARQEGHQGVSVPTRSKKLKCSWRKVGGNFKWLPFEDMLKALDFSLENAVSIRKDGGVIIQKVGIPMGDALSPAMTIGTCGWMEREFMRGLHKDTKNNFKAKRYMDDVLLFMKKEGWDATRFYEDFKRSECYMPPLHLEEANDGTFLETSFEVQHGRINYRLKNTNARSKEVWRYHSFDSYATFGQKKSTMIAALKKVDYFASDNSERMVSAIHKLREFKNLDYPNAMRREVCETLMQESGNVVWRIVGALQAQI